MTQPRRRRLWGEGLFRLRCFVYAPPNACMHSALFVEGVQPAVQMLLLKVSQ